MERGRCRRVALLVALLAASPARADEPPPKGLTLQKAVKLALAHSPDLRVARHGIDKADATRRRVRGAYLPSLRFESRILVWDNKVEVSFGNIPGLNIDVPPTVVRDQVTTSTTLTVIQPLSAIWEIWESHAITKLGLSRARLEHDRSQHVGTARVIDVYVTALQTDSMVRLAHQSVRQRTAQLERVKRLYDNEAIGRDQLLQVRVGVADARHRLLEAKRDAALVRAHLAILLGLPGGTTLQLAALPEAHQRVAKLPPVERLIETALRSRIEVSDVRLAIEQAERAVRVAWSQMVPQVGLVGTYEHATGSGAFGQENSFFFGVNIRWAVWEWGQSRYRIDESKADLGRARAGLRKLEDGIRLEVRSAHTRARNALSMIALAAETSATAAERYELTKARFDANAATTFDVLDAEAQLTLAKIRLEAGRFELIRARNELLRATGASSDRLVAGWPETL